MHAKAICGCYDGNYPMVIFKCLNGFHISMCPITLFVCYCSNIIWPTRQHLLNHFLLKFGLDSFPLYA